MNMCTDPTHVPTHAVSEQDCKQQPCLFLPFAECRKSMGPMAVCTKHITCLWPPFNPLHGLHTSCCLEYSHILDGQPGDVSYQVLP